MRERVIHVYHPRAELLADAIREAAPTRRLVTWSERAQLAAGLADVEVLFAPRPPRAGWSEARRLELLQLAGAGVDHLLPSPDLPPRVRVAGVRGVFADDVADHAILLLLALTRRLPELLAHQGRREWRPLALPRLRGQRLLVLGLGAIGRAVAARAAALGMHVEGVRRRPCAVSHVAQVARVHGPEDLREAARRADALVVCVPLTPATRGLVDAAVLEALPEGARVVDVSRGGVIDAEALLAAVRGGALGGVARDVFEAEPLPADSPWWDAPRTIVTPHVAGLGERYVEQAVAVLLDNVRRLERGEPLTHLVDRAAGY